MLVLAQRGAGATPHKWELKHIISLPPPSSSDGPPPSSEGGKEFVLTWNIEI